MNRRNICYDVIVVGSGAAGAMAAKRLCDGGATVLLLEAGDYPTASEESASSKSAQSLSTMKARQPVQSLGLHYQKDNRHMFIDDLDNPYTRADGTKFNWIRSRGVGGRTSVWSRFATRLCADDFNHPANDGKCTRWPLCYEDLAPYYDTVESLIRVRGTTEGLASLPDGKFLPRHVPQYLVELRKQLAHRYPGRHLLPAREAAIDIRSRDSASSVPDSAISSLIPVGSERLCFRTNCVVTQVKIDREDRASGVLFIDRKTHELQEASAKAIVLCASTIESARILLASTSADYPTGLANSSGTLGHYLMDHFGGCRALAVGKIDGIEPHHHEIAYIPRFDHLHESTQNFVGSYVIQMDIRAEGTGSALISFGVLGEVQPHFDNAVSLDKSRRDSCNRTVPRISYSYRDNECHMALHAQSAVREIIEALDFKLMTVHDELLPGGTRAHELGTVRMGSSADESVLNAYNQSWDINNLYVTDGASFPSAGTAGPTLTIMALSTRACDHVLNRLRSGDL